MIEVSATRLQGVKNKFGVPNTIRACHTATVDGYVVEGHVPADLIRRLLKDRPDVVGIGVAGMPIGSPGMPGLNPEAYGVYAFDRIPRRCGTSRTSAWGHPALQLAKVHENQ